MKYLITFCLIIFPGANSSVWAQTKKDVIVQNQPKLLPDSIFTDTRDGMNYKFRHIGTQVWMTQNLNYSAANSFCYDNNPANCVTYGHLYSWNTALLVSPPGWHLPTYNEWQILISFLGDYSVAGGSMKSVVGWNQPNSDATNKSRFSALPSGCHHLDDYIYKGMFAYFWTSTEKGASIAGACILKYVNGFVESARLNKLDLCTVRCVRN